MKIAISAGHNPKAVGAKYSNFKEYAENALISGFLINWLENSDHSAYIVPTGPLASKVDFINNLNCDCAIEIHLNMGGGSGSETLYCPGSEKGKILANFVQDSLITDSFIKNRGIKEGWYRMISPPDPNAIKDYFLKSTNCPAIISEPFFMDGDFKLLGKTDIYREIAKLISIGIDLWSRNK